MVELFANSGDPVLMPHSVVSDLGLLCLPVTSSGVISFQWVKTDTVRREDVQIFGINTVDTCAKSEKL